MPEIYAYLPSAGQESKPVLKRPTTPEEAARCFDAFKDDYTEFKKGLPKLLQQGGILHLESGTIILGDLDALIPSEERLLLDGSKTVLRQSYLVGASHEKLLGHFYSWLASKPIEARSQWKEVDDVLKTTHGTWYCFPSQFSEKVVSRKGYQNNTTEDLTVDPKSEKGVTSSSMKVILLGLIVEDVISKMLRKRYIDVPLGYGALHDKFGIYFLLEEQIRPFSSQINLRSTVRQLLLDSGIKTA